MTQKIKIEDFVIGSVVAEMHLHQTNWGTLKGWKVYSPFEIPEEMFVAMYQKLPVVDERQTKVIENKYARAISVTEDYEGNASAALVIYSYDHRYYCAQLIDPDWDAKLSTL